MEERREGRFGKGGPSTALLHMPTIRMRANNTVRDKINIIKFAGMAKTLASVKLIRSHIWKCKAYFDVWSRGGGGVGLGLGGSFGGGGDGVGDGCWGLVLVVVGLIPPLTSFSCILAMELGASKLLQNA